MNLETLLLALRGFDLGRLTDWGSLGSWPLALKASLWLIVFLAALACGYLWHLAGLQAALERARAQEAKLKADYQRQHSQVVHLDAYQLQQQQLEAAYQAALKQLPGGDEIPGLIEDITLAGIKNGLTFDSIELQEEVKQDFYLERPISIRVRGGYHGLGAFLGQVARLPRIVTLHDLAVLPASRQATAKPDLAMRVLVKIYRHEDAQD